MYSRKANQDQQVVEVFQGKTNSYIAIPRPTCVGIHSLSVSKEPLSCDIHTLSPSLGTGCIAIFVVACSLAYT